MMATDRMALVVLAAGLGSRFGGMKQMAAVGPDGEKLLDYAVFDALRAGFSDIIFVIRSEFENEFRQQVGMKFEASANVRYVMQRMDDGAVETVDRIKPWGTGHAVLSARQAIASPFAVVNADDYYGPAAFRLARAQFADFADRAAGDALLVGYELGQTLSPHGSVSRGVCSVDADGMLESVAELTDIQRAGDEIQARSNNEMSGRVLPADTLVSLNFWAFREDFLVLLQERFEEFLSVKANHATAEFFLPSAVGELIHRGDLRVRVERSCDTWFGMTYADDRPYVERSLHRLIRDGVYPTELSFQ